jgi:F0F1-type ATP synthase assembly protein I
MDNLFSWIVLLILGFCFFIKFVLASAEATFSNKKQSKRKNKWNYNKFF